MESTLPFAHSSTLAIGRMRIEASPAEPAWPISGHPRGCAPPAFLTLYRSFLPMTLAFAPDRIETWPLERLRPYAQNAKQHGPDQVARIAASMAAFGWTVPCLVAEDGELIAGHGRVLAAMELGLTEAPVIVLAHLTEAQRRAYRIADNRLTELGTWDEALLAGELRHLLAEDFDLGLTGFADGELDRLLALDPEAGDEDGGA
ncbi:ParB/Srx family N-terminal domain-containing protein [Erythrobacter tepidarius]|uniref:ParB/Srx family N-terminal domain-containing protein n=1 Tax=Erythrobacter tepidarius TaxID=60454 RepID=UPI001B80BF10|nr:ParB/Srx family N-terminal domain-containing protein [Erythrobacter tepidarius]